MAKKKSLLGTFEGLPETEKESLADLDSPLLQSFAALEIAQRECGVAVLTAEHITACLEAAGVAVPKLSVSRALARAGKRVSRRTNEEGDNTYKLMIQGKRQLSDALGSGTVSVVRVEGGQPRTARSRLADALCGLKGLVRICDPYYGVRTLDSLDHVPVACPVRFLTARTSEAGRRLTGALRDFRRERPTVEFRIAAKGASLHDRYVMASQVLLILGHGLKDIGGKESFILRVDRNVAGDLIQETVRAFDRRWAAASPL